MKRDSLLVRHHEQPCLRARNPEAHLQVQYTGQQVNALSPRSKLTVDPQLAVSERGKLGQQVPLHRTSKIETDKCLTLSEVLRQVEPITAATAEKSIFGNGK